MTEPALSPLLNAYDTLIFDLDGVLTSEQMYWNTAALTIYEMLFSAHYFGSQPLSAKELTKTVSAIRNDVFCRDQTIVTAKNLGINSNWDLAYVVLGMKLILGENASFRDVLHELSGFSGDVFSLFRNIAGRLSARYGKDLSYFERSGPFWQDKVVICFQEWFLGDEYYKQSTGRSPHLPGKPGFMMSEEPVVDKQKLRTLFDLFRTGKKRLCVGTGRPRLESESVLKEWGLFSYFSDDGFITFDDVETAQETLANEGIRCALPKPHPFMFIKACFGERITLEQILAGDYSTEIAGRTLVVGDAGADLYAAKAAGFDFAAVLTGVQGEKARAFFEKEKADYILDSVLDFMREN